MDELKCTLHVFEKCPHCSEIYHFFVEFEDPESSSPIYVAMPARSKQEAFILLEKFREHSKVPMSETEYSNWGREIASSSLPELDPDDSVLKKQANEHTTNVGIVNSVQKTIRLLKLLKVNPVNPPPN